MRLQLILIGTMLEGVLYENLSRNKKVTKSIPNFYKRNMTLGDLLHWSKTYNVISDDMFRLSEPVRDYRNLIHPNTYNKTKLLITKNKVDISLGVLLEVINLMKSRSKVKDDSDIKRKIISTLSNLGKTPTESDFIVYIPLIKKYGEKNGIKMIKLSILNNK